MQALELLASYPLALAAVGGILGLLVGSFLNVVIYRLPLILEREWKSQCEMLLAEGEEETTAQISDDSAETFNLVYPNSRCPHCGTAIKAWQNIPVISYLFLRGKCANCQASISIRYPLIELCTAILSFIVVWHFGYNWQSVGMLLVTWSLIALTMIDCDHQLLPDNITLPLLWLGLIANTFGLFASLSDALWGAVGGYMVLWSIYWLFKLVTGKEGMGYGDFKLLAALGAWFGWQALPVIIILSSLVGAIIGILLIILRNQGKSVPIPFGPYLAIAGWIAAIWGHQITEAYLQFSGMS